MFSREKILAEIAKEDRLLFRSTSDTYIYNVAGAKAAFKYVDEHPEMSTLDALDAFIKKMDEYSCMARTDASSFMFSTIKAIAEYISDCYISEIVGGIIDFK